jgi:hypothetical protein
MIANIALTTRFPRAVFYPDWSLLAWHPAGIFDEATSDRMMDFIELSEKVQGAPFYRYTDMTGFSGIRVGLSHVVRLARRRHLYRGPAVKSALYATSFVSLTIAHMYAELMKDSRIKVSTFRSRPVAADWLGVPRKILQPPVKEPRR